MIDYHQVRGFSDEMEKIALRMPGFIARPAGAIKQKATGLYQRLRQGLRANARPGQSRNVSTGARMGAAAREFGKGLFG